MALSLLFGWQRKLALLPLGLFMVGWLVYAIGFIWDLIESDKQSSAEEPRPFDPSSPVYFPYYLTLVGGPVVYLTGALHAILAGVASAVTWVCFSLLCAVYFTSVSWVMYERGLNSTSSSAGNSDTQLLRTQSAVTQSWMMFEGTLFCVVCWCILQILAVFYRNKNVDQNQNVNHSQDCLSAPVLAGNRRQLPFKGPARALSILFILMSFVSWCVFVAGYAGWDAQLNDGSLEHLINLFDGYSRPVVLVVFIVTPLLHLSSVLHAGCSGKASTMAVFTALLHVLFVMSTGFIIVHLVLYLLNNCDKNDQSRNCFDEVVTNSNYNLMLGGCIVSLISWTFVYSLVPFYQDFKAVQRGTPGNDLNIPAETPLATGTPPPNYDAAQSMVQGDNEEQPLLAENAQ